LTFTNQKHILLIMKDNPSITKQLYPLAMAYAFVLAALFVLGSGMSFHSAPDASYSKDTISQQASFTQPASSHELASTNQWLDVNYPIGGAVYLPGEQFFDAYHFPTSTANRRATPLPVKRFILYSCLKLGDYTPLV